MATPSAKLAESLEVLEALQKEGSVAIRSADLSRVHRERLLKGGFLREVMKGWYIPARPDELAGESTAWYACFWDFCAAYLRERFGDAWCLSPEQSLLLHTGNRTVPVNSSSGPPKAETRQRSCSTIRRCSMSGPLCPIQRIPSRSTVYGSTHSKRLWRPVRPVYTAGMRPKRGQPFPWSKMRLIFSVRCSKANTAR